MRFHPLTNFEILKYHQNKPRLNSVYSRNNLPKTKDGAYLINRDEFKSIGTHWIAFYVDGNDERSSYDAMYFDRFGVKNIPKEVKKVI